MHFIYHYSKEKYSSLLTRRKAGTLSREELAQADADAKKYYSVGSYNDQISFFFDRPPIDILPTLYKGQNDFWKEGNEVYEYTVPVEGLGKHIKYFTTETPEAVKLMDRTDWSDESDENTVAYYKKKRELLERLGHIGVGMDGLKREIDKFEGKTRYYYLAASKRYDFDDNIKKYAANVPHLMLYPPSGEIHFTKVVKLVIGKKDESLLREATNVGWALAQW
jgi:hypothetical protein